MKTCFIFNPRSGHNQRDPHLLDRARRFVSDHRLDARVLLSERPRHATALARAAVADGCRLVVAIGGDGTMNEVASGLVGTDAALGLIPCGSGNGLGRHLGIPSPGRGAFRTLVEGRVRRIDTGSVNGLPFFNLMGLGFDAEIAARFNQLARRGLPAYIRTTWNTWFDYRPASYTIRHGSGPLDTAAFLVAVANSDQYGNDCFIAPGARVDDGLLDLTLLRRVAFDNALPLAARLFLGRLDGSASVVRRRSRHFTIRRLTPGLIHTDGETHFAHAELDVRVHPASLNIMVPAAR